MMAACSTTCSEMPELTHQQLGQLVHDKSRKILDEKHWLDGFLHINKGHCTDLASRVYHELPPGSGVTVMQYEDPDGHKDHQWLEYEGRHYDAEHPGGVDDWRRLKHFRHVHEPRAQPYALRTR